MGCFNEPSNDYEGQQSLDRAPWAGLEFEDPVGNDSFETLINLVYQGAEPPLSKFYPISIQRSESKN